MKDKNMKTTTAIEVVINNKLAECGVSPDALPTELRERLNARFLDALTETNVEREFLRLRTSRRMAQLKPLTLRGVSDEEYRSFIEKAGYFPTEELIANVKARHVTHLGPSFLGEIWHEWGKNKAAEKKVAEASQHEAPTSVTNKLQSKTSRPKEKVDTSAAVETRNVGVKNALPTTSPEHRGIAPNATVIPVSAGQQNRGSSSEDSTPRERTAEARNVGAKNIPSMASPKIPCATPNGASIPAPTGRQDRGSTLEEPVYRADPNSIGGMRDKRSCTYGGTPPQGVSSPSLARASNGHNPDAADLLSDASSVPVVQQGGKTTTSSGYSGGPPPKPLAGGQNATVSPVTPKDTHTSAQIKSDGCSYFFVINFKNNE